MKPYLACRANAKNKIFAHLVCILLKVKKI